VPSSRFTFRLTFVSPVDTVANKVYVANGSNLTVIDGMTNATSNVMGANAGVIAVNSATNRIYVTGNNSVIAISGAT
jgi:DNA-binding beta-propeller fold protein YncE